MQFCEQCGSTSFDEQGFCRGCGALLQEVKSDSSSSSSTATQQVPQQTESKATIGSIPLAQAQVKNVWVAVLLASLLGPLGMLYCTVPGALVMFAVSVFAALFLGKIVAFLAVPAACAVWAGLAARSANSIY
jgi:membrane protein YqaA with SNARE-associated domain